MVEQIESKPEPRNGRLASIGMAMGVLALLSWNVINRYDGDSMGIDPGIFAAIGFHMSEGKVPYRDAWDHKPPMVFLLNAIGFWIDGDWEGVRKLQRLFAVISAESIFLILLTVFGRITPALVGSLAFLVHLYHPILYGGGNFTEEYGIGFTLLGILTVVRCRLATGRMLTWGALVAGFFFGLATLTKEPFLLAAIPWWVYLLMASNSNTGYKLKLTGLFVLGSAAPVFLWAVYFVANGALSEWLDSIHYSLLYVGSQRKAGWAEASSESLLMFSDLVASTTVTGTVLFLAGMVSALHRRFNLLFAHFPSVTFFSLLAHALATTLSGWSMNHYLIQMALPFALIAGIGTAYLGWLLQTRGRAWILYALLGALALMPDFEALTRVVRPMLEKREPHSPHPIVTTILAHTSHDDTIWVSTGHGARIYAEAERFSPTPQLAPFEHHFLETSTSTSQQKWERILADLDSARPKFIVTGISGNIRTGETRGNRWFEENYVEVPTEFDGAGVRLYVLKDAEGNLQNKTPGSPYRAAGGD